MTEEQKTACVWLMMEYKAKQDKLNTEGLATLVYLRDEWNLNRAEEVLLKEVEDEDA